MNLALSRQVVSEIGLSNQICNKNIRQMTKIQNMFLTPKFSSPELCKAFFVYISSFSAVFNLNSSDIEESTHFR